MPNQFQSPAVQPVSDTGQYQDAAVSEEDALTTALQASRLELPDASRMSEPTSYNSASRVLIPTVAGGSSSVPHPTATPRPRISSQLGGAWLEVLDRDAADELHKEMVRLAKMEAASDAKKSVDVLWYDKV